MVTYPVVEKFISINGEGTKAGELAVFIRFRKCNLNCSYCDTKWANINSTYAEMMTAEEIVEFSENIKNVTLTGGEPMLQNLFGLVEILMNKGHDVEIETNGSISIDDLANSKYRPSFTMDYKLPSSNMEKNMFMGNFRFLEKNDTVKFVIGSFEDMKRAYEVILEYELTEKCHVYFSPVFGNIEPSEIVQFMKENKLNNVRLQLQLHKYIWNPTERGV